MEKEDFEAIVALLLLPFLVAWNGFVLTCLWSWFVVHAFNIPDISVAEACGIVLIVSWLTAHGNTRKSKDKPLEQEARSAFLALFMLGFGALINLFM